MLVSNIMQVLKNLFGLNKKISADTIAIKDSSNNVYTLDNYLNNGEVYSTSEKRVGTWIDGKPLYRKVIKFTDSMSGSSLFTKSHGISNVDLIWIEEWIYVSSVTDKISYTLPLTGYNGNLTEKQYCYANRENIYSYGNGGWNNNWNKIVILKYTKTTD